MGRYLAAGLVIVVACAGANTPTPAQSVESPRPVLARVVVTDVTVGLSKPDGRPWDGPSTPVTAEDAAALATALGAADPVTAVASVIARPAVIALDKPEVKGQATLFLRAQPQPPQTFRGQRDTMRPQLAPQPSWIHVPLDGSARIELVLVDEDLAFDDPVGTLVVSAEALSTAAAAGKIYQFKVADQTWSAVLFVGISVIPE